MEGIVGGAGYSAAVTTTNVLLLLFLQSLSLSGFNTLGAARGMFVDIHGSVSDELIYSMCDHIYMRFP
jgi:hypothetical protein